MVQRINIRLGGDIGTTALERWSVGLNYGFGGTTLTQTDAQTVAQALADLWAGSATTLGSLVNGVGAAVSLKTVDVYGYANTGPSVSHGAAVLSPARSFTGTQTAPPQTTGCITLQTAVPGRSFRGRIYWPQCAPTLDTSFKSTTAKGLGAGLKTMNDAIEAVLNPLGAWALAVYSAKLDVVTPVTAVRSGDVLDTQRRRRDDLFETYTTTAV